MIDQDEGSEGFLLHNVEDRDETREHDSIDSRRAPRHHVRPFKNPRNMVYVLFIVYIWEGIPSGLIGVTLPIILKPALGFTRTGLFTVCFYPASLKLLWAPIVDSVWVPQIGRRRTWLVFTMILIGCIMLTIAVFARVAFSSLMEGSTIALVTLLILCFLAIFVSATQGCAIDGWAVAELPEEYQAAGSAAHEMAFMLGEFTAGSAFLFLRDTGYVSLSAFYSTVGLLMVGLGFVLLALPESPVHPIPTGPKEAYRSALQLFFKPPVQSLIIVHLLSRLAFEADDSATNLRLLDKGFTTSGIAFLTSLDLPSDLLASSIAAWLCKRYTATGVWRSAFVGRLATTVISLFLVAICPENDVSNAQFAFNSINRSLSIFMRSIMFVSILTFHLQIVDSTIGSVYMTLLATALNLGRTFPQAIVMSLIDVTTKRDCSKVIGRNSNGPRDAPASSIGEGCTVVIDGYLVVGTTCVIVGGLLYLCYLRRTIMRLQGLPKSDWLVT